MTETANILQAISIILACWAVIAGIDAWKREFIGKRRIELAESLLAKFYEVNILKYKAMASFAKDAGEIFDRTNKVLNSIFISAHMLGTHYWQRQGRVRMEGDEFKKHLEEMHKQEGIFCDMYKDEDEIRKELYEILLLLEKITKPCFEEPSILYSLATKKLLKRS